MYEHITIFRNEEAVEVSVEILKTYNGSESIDDPSEYRADEYGTTHDGKDILLTESEQLEALQTAFAI
jgi:hypothetical protein